MPSAIPCSLSPLISRIHSSLFSDWRRTVSSTDRQVPSISTEEFVLPRLACYGFSRLCCNGHSLLLSSIDLELAESRILLAAPAGTRPRTSLISFCTVQPPSLCAARCLATSGLGPEELPDFWGSMVFYHTFIPGKGSGSNHNNN